MRLREIGHSPIPAGVLEGYHLMCDNFGKFLARDWAPGDFDRISAESTARATAARPKRFRGAEKPPSPLAEFYYDYIRDNCPA